MELNSHQLVGAIKRKMKVFREACAQIVLLNNKIIAARTRYQRALQVRRQSFRYNYRMRLTVLENARNYTHDYAGEKCTEIEDLQEKLRQMPGAEDIYSDDSDDESLVEEVDSEPEDGEQEDVLLEDFATSATSGE